MAFPKLLPLNYALRIVLIIAVYFDSFQTKFSQMFHVFYLFIFLNTLYENYLKKKSFIASKELFILLVFLFYLTLNSHFLCCSESNLRILMRFGVATSLYMIFYYFNSRRIIFPLTIIVSYLNLITVTISLIGLFLPELWLKMWRLALSPEGYSYQYFEISRGRISSAVPIYLTTILPISLLSYKKGHHLLAGISIISAVISVLLWGYRSYVLSLVFGLVIVLYMFSYLKNNWAGKISLMTGRIKLISFSVFLLYMFFARYYLSVNIWERFILKFNVDKQATAARRTLIENAFELFRSHPVGGVGAGNFPIYQKPVEIRLTTPKGDDLGIKISDIALGPHNIFLEFISETGIIGFSLFVFLLASFVTTDIKLLRSFKKPNYNAKNFRVGITYLLIAISGWLFIIASQFNSYTKGGLYLFFAFRGIVGSINLNKKYI